MQDIYNLQDNGYRVSISSRGAELLRFDAPSGEPFIWPRNPDIWGGSAPILFPIIGRLKEARYQWQNTWYKLPKHGLVRDREWQLIDLSPCELTLQTTSDETTLTHYPFVYQLRAHFSVQGPRLQVSYRVSAIGDTPLVFNLGSHPAFYLPLDHGQSLSDYSIDFEAEESLQRHRLIDGLVARDAEPIAEAKGKRRIQLSDHIFDDDALILRNLNSRKLCIRHKRMGRRITFNTGGAPHLGIWAKAGADYVCLEPWYGHDDWVDTDQDFSKKANLIQLQPGEHFQTGYIIELHTRY